MKAIKALVIATILLIGLNAFGQYRFDTISPAFPTMSIGPVYFDYASNILANSSDSTGQNYTIQKYDGSVWHAMAPNYVGTRLYYDFNYIDGYNIDTHNNIWSGTDSVFLKLNDSGITSYRNPFYKNPSAVFATCIDDSNNIWELMSIYDTNNTTINSSMHLIKFDGINWTDYRLINYDTSGLFISGATLNTIQGQNQMYWNDHKIFLLGDNNPHANSVMFDGHYLSYVNFAVPNPIYNRFIGRASNGITLTTGYYNLMEDIGVIGYDSNGVYLFDDSISPPSISSGAFSLLGSYEQLDNRNTVWYAGLNDTVCYFNPFLNLNGKIQTPSYLGVLSPAVGTGYFVLNNPVCNIQGNILLLNSSTSGGSNPLPNTRLIELNLDSFYFYLPTSAGPDQIVCENSIIQMAASGEGRWISLSSNPVFAHITDSLSPITTISNLSATGIYKFIWQSNKLDTVAITVISSVIPSIHITATTNVITNLSNQDTFSIITTNGGNSPTYNWYINGINMGSDTFFTYWSSLFLNGDSVWAVMNSSISCASPTSITSNKIYITVPGTNLSDTIWPGDADHNRMVDNNDLLPIGLGYDSVGAARINATIVWQGQQVPSWQEYFPIYNPAVNYDNADCNGDGTINALDTTAIMNNFSLTHAKTNGYNANWRSGTPGITLAFSKDTAVNGDMLLINVLLGDSTTPVSNIYGLAFTLNYDALIADSTMSSFQFTNSWLGNSTNSININKNLSATGLVKAAITGIDHTERSGSGQIAAMNIEVTTGNINGKDLSYYNNVAYISDVTAIDQYGNPVPLNAGIDSDVIAYTPTGIGAMSSPAVVNIYPNPATGQIRVMADAAMTEISITDMLGQTVKDIKVNSKQSESIDIAALQPGIYTVHAASVKGYGTAKLVVR